MRIILWLGPMFYLMQLMRVFAWGCVASGVLLGVAAFIITAHSPANPWPTLVAGFCLTMVGVITLALKQDVKR
jgi:hypothetical protein